MLIKPHNWVYLAIVLAVLLHGALLPFTYGQTYDAYIHMFFSDHYYRQWFDPWEPRWYTGFTVTAYPPGSHQTIALLMNFMDMRAAFITVMTGSIAALTIGIYRFSKIWVSEKAAAIAALLLVLSSSVAETVHVFGQLPTIFSIALFLNAMPHMSAWIEKGGWGQLALALIFTGGATSAHHVTPLFGTIFFVAPIGVAAWHSHIKRTAPLAARLTRRKNILRILTAPGRGILLGICMLLLVVTIVFPYWHWSITDPIRQVSVPHGSRESFIDKPDLGLMFFVIPWGLLIFTIPYVIFKTIKTPLWPLGFSVLLTLFLGTGGTTPFPRMVLGPAFDILTLDRFTFWGSLLILPFAGLFAISLMEGRGRALLNRAFGAFPAQFLLVSIFASYALMPIAIANLPKIRPTQPEFVDPVPIAKFMDEDGHSQWRYLTLGLGDQFAYHSALIDAESVDGNYNSARRLPSLTNYAVERLENSKFAGVPGLASLGQFLTNADHFHLKYVFSNDEYYDPLLHYTGWNPITRLANGMVVWEKANISPLPDVRARRVMPRYQVLMWGILPMSALLLSVLAAGWLAIRGRLIRAPSQPFYQESKLAQCLSGLWVIIARVVPLVVVAAFVLTAYKIYNRTKAPLSAEETVGAYYGHLDFREYRQAYELLETDLSFEEYLREQRLTGGLVPSYGKLNGVGAKQFDGDVYDVGLNYLTAMDYKTVSVKHRLVLSNGIYKIAHSPDILEYVREMTSRNSDSVFTDQTARDILRPGKEAVAKLQRPRFTVSETYLFEKEGRFYAAGMLTSQSPFPACISLQATARDKSGKAMLTQNMGRHGAHRLLPGETSSFVIAFEGFLKIGDASFNTVYDPDYYSVPEFPEPPARIDLDAQSTVCNIPVYRNLRFSDFEVLEDRIYLTVENYGAKIVSTLQIKVTQNRPNAEFLNVFPFYLQRNLNPGESRRIEIPLAAPSGRLILMARHALVNGLESSAGPIPPERFGIETEFGAFRFDYDAMTYDQLR